MFLTSLYMKIKNWLQTMMKQETQDDYNNKKLIETIIETENDSRSDTDYYCDDTYNNFY